MPSTPAGGTRESVERSICCRSPGYRRRVRINPVQLHPGALGTGAIPTRHPSRPGRSPNADYTQHVRVRSTASGCVGGWGPRMWLRRFVVIELREFQRQFIAGATADHVDVACLSTPRGNGKSCLAAHVVRRATHAGRRTIRAGHRVHPDQRIYRAVPHRIQICEA